MAKRRKRAAAGEAEAHVSAQEKVARLLAFLLMKDIKNNTEKVPLLRSAGFDVAEVADMLDISPNQVRVADHVGRKSKKKSG